MKQLVLRSVFAYTLALIAWGLASTMAVACTSTQSCITNVHAEVDRQNRGVSGGPQWQLSEYGCQIASREQSANEARCRAYDEQPVGKTLAQCATCLRQAVFDAARWERCHANGWAPSVPSAIYASIARLGQQLAAF